MKSGDHPTIMSQMRWSQLLGRVAGAAACAVTVVSAAAPAAHAVDTPADLGSVLAPPPQGDYQPRSETLGQGIQLGSLDSTAFAKDAGLGNQETTQLAGYQFTRAFFSGWIETTTHTVLEEMVAEFRLNSGATRFLLDYKPLEQAHDPNLRGFFDTPGLSQAFGIRGVVSGVETDTVILAKGNLWMMVLTARAGQGTTDLALAQATKQYTTAPDETLPQPPSGASSAGSGGFDPAEALGRLMVIGLLAALVIGLPVLLIVRSRGRTTPAAGLPTLSPDRRYWWDGTTWRDARSSPPPAAPRSPDGEYWFDGVQWRPVRSLPARLP